MTLGTSRQLLVEGPLADGGGQCLSWVQALRSSAARMVRHSHLAWWLGSCWYPGGSASMNSFLYLALRAGGGLGCPG